MSFPRYESYKNSEVEWLGKVPTPWTICALNYRYDVALGKMLDQKRVSGRHLFPYLRNVDVQWDRINIIELPVMDFDGADLVRYALSPGDLLVCEGGEVGRAAVWEGPLQHCYYQKALHRLRPRDKTRDVPRYLFYALYLAAKLGVFAGSEGKSTIAHLTAEVLRRYRFGFPSFAEQVAIVAFLDRETAKIDALVEEQKRLIDLLKEKRQAVISHTVTKGLDPNAPMKPSGVGQLGDIPEHWKITPLKWLTDPKRPIMYGIVLPGPDVDHGIPILKGGNVRPSRMNLQAMARTTSEIEAPYARARLKKGDLVYSIRGSIGYCESVPAELEGSNITQDVARVAVADGVCASWARWALLASPIRDGLASGSLGAAVRGINIFDLKRASIPTPPPEEQAAIAAFIGGEVARLEQLAAEADRAIALLQERRTAIISAAVTGKIDLRGLVSSEAEAA
jgi:type I restriction enzyme S subunit